MHPLLNFRMLTFAVAILLLSGAGGTRAGRR